MSKADNVRHRNKKRKLRLIRERGPTCEFCHNEFTPERLTIEHVRPISCGGTNDPGNIALACGPCNLERNRYNQPARKPCPGCGQKRRCGKRWCEDCRRHHARTPWNVWQKAKLLGMTLTGVDVTRYAHKVVENG